ncbi:MAG: adenine methyltransferase [Ruminococcaceae bacterium]|nr:adenine methyltransferase [Oscillospiraceae bacterium]
MKNDVMFSSKTCEWATPQDLFDKLNSEFCFTLDPCADDNNHKLAKYYTKQQNGLKHDWSGETVFCNPPYGKEIYNWVKKCFCEVYAGTCPCAVMLVPARTDTRWFHEYIYHKAEVRFIRGRLRFGGSDNSAPFPSMVVVFRK